VISRTSPDLFTPYYPRFLLRTDDLRQVKQDKIRLLLRIVNPDTYQVILREFIDYADDPDDEIGSESIRAIGRCARLMPECTQQCLTALITMIKSAHDSVVSSAVLVLKHLVQTQLSAYPSNTAMASGQSPLTIISHLAHRIDDIRHAQARACVLWLAGQYSASDERVSDSSRPMGVADWAPDLLRKAAKGFGNEPPLVKLQIITLAAKLLVLCPTDRRLSLLCNYVFSLARYDLDYDVRDRGRMLTSLLVGLGVTSSVNGRGGEEEHEDVGGVVLRREQVRLVLFDGKMGVEDVDSTTSDDSKEMLGSLSVITKKPMRSDSILPDWLEQGVEPSMRDTEDDAPRPPVATALSSAPAPQQHGKVLASPIVLTPRMGSSPAGGSSIKNGKGPYTNLDEFYADDDNGAEEEEAESEEEEDEEEEDSSEGESESEEDDDSNKADASERGGHSR